MARIHPVSLQGGEELNTPFFLRRKHQQAIIDHALSLKPVEACGIIASHMWTGGARSRLLRMNNIAEEWGTSFEFEPEQQIAVWNELETRGEVVAAVYHSHTKHVPVPSRRDIEGARALDPLTTHIIVSVRDGEEPVMKAWKIGHDGSYTEVDLEIIDDAADSADS
jgi:proteasome lid subunit RPN8/RPN11